MAYTERLKAFYAKYDPMKVDGVFALLKKYKGKEEELMSEFDAQVRPRAASSRSQRELRRARKESSPRQSRRNDA